MGFLALTVVFEVDVEATAEVAVVAVDEAAVVVGVVFFGGLDGSGFLLFFPASAWS